MFDIGWSELLLVAVIAIVVVGPRDLPRALRAMGQWMNRIRRAAREFQSNIDEMVRETELEDLRKEARELTQFEFDGKPPTQARIDPNYNPEYPFTPPADGDASDGEAEADDAYAADAAMAPPHSLPRPAEAAPAGPRGDGIDDDDEAPERPSSRKSA
jgi:sec-independent protein translocase protein TatB